mgnify:CR=1 FL=1
MQERQPEEEGEFRVELYNRGLQAYLDGDPAEAVACWGRLRELSPSDWRLREKLIQALWADGRFDEAGEEIAGLIRARESDQHEALREREFFVRDQFECAGIRVFALQYFALKGERPLLWKFVLRSGEETLDRHFSVGSYAATNAAMRAMGAIPADGRGYHLDGYRAGGVHETYVFFKGEPDYAGVRHAVAEILAGRRDPIASTDPESGD